MVGRAGMRMALVIVVAASAMVGMAAGSVLAETAFERAQRTGEVFVGFANEAPYAYATPDGRLTGEAVEHGYLLSSGVSPSQIVIVPDQPSAVAALQAGRVDAITMTGPALQAVLDAAGDPNLERVQDFEDTVIDGRPTRGYGAAAFRKEDDDFRQAFNRELEALKASGELLDILSEFGFTAQELPGDMTAEELCR